MRIITRISVSFGRTRRNSKLYIGGYPLLAFMNMVLCLERVFYGIYSGSRVFSPYNRGLAVLALSPRHVLRGDRAYGPLGNRASGQNSIKG